MPSRQKTLRRPPAPPSKMRHVSGYRGMSPDRGTTKTAPVFLPLSLQATPKNGPRKTTHHQNSFPHSACWACGLAFPGGFAVLALLAPDHRPLVGHTVAQEDRQQAIPELHEVPGPPKASRKHQTRGIFRDEETRKREIFFGFKY